MWPNDISHTYKHDLILERPFVNSPGSLGFFPDPHTMPFLGHLGAFITNPISLRPRKPADSRACLPFAGGFLLHTGLPNPGIRRVISQNRKRWAKSPLPIIVHLITEPSSPLSEMVRMLEGLENVLAVELGIPHNCEPDALAGWMEAAQGELPVILSLCPQQIPSLLEPIKTLQPGAVHLTGSRGALPGPEEDTISGRLHGPGNFPLLLHAMPALVKTEIPVIAGGGVYDQRQVNALRNSGATAVSLGSILWQVDQNTLFPD